LRRSILGVAVLAVFCALHLVAQPAQPYPGPRPASSQGTDGGSRPAAALTAPQAIFDAGSLGSPLVLDKNWRVGVTDDPAAAAPAFDDSTWALRDAQPFIADVPEEDSSAGGHDRGNQPASSHSPGQRFAWFRLHIKLLPNHGPVSLLIELPVPQGASLAEANPGLDVFANGKEILPEGPHRDASQRYQQISRVYNLNLPPSETSLTLAVRTLYVPFGIGAYTGFFAARTFHLGNPSDLGRALELWSAHNLFEHLPKLVTAILLLVLALFLLALYFSQKGHIEYLWLALYELLQMPLGFLALAGSSARVELLFTAAADAELVLISAYLYFEFLIAFLTLRRRWYISLLRYTAPILAAFGPALFMWGYSTHTINQGFIEIALAVAGLGTGLWVFGWLLFVFSTLIVATLRRNFEAGLLLIPLVLSMVGVLEPIVMAGMSDLGGRTLRSPLTIQAGPVPIHFASIADFTGILVIVLIIFGRFLRIHRTQERVTSELAAARSVQELMIPQEKLETPGFAVDSVYHPANEVGGDFFHLQPAPDGGLLVVIGDVTGKGLRAAMNVSMLMGALRRTLERSPAKILESLNRVLTGSESFTTCQAAWFGADGEVTLANAGHLPPYLNSQEIGLPGGLPLGVLPDLTYEEVRFYLHPGDRMLFLSDGVVEARHPSGELFGFDRVHNMSNQTAFYIAEAARTFGQEDDITVLTVRRLAQAVAA
jgi:hypothetical protein